MRKVKIKTTMRYHFTLVRMAIIKKFTNNNARKGVEKREPSRTISADKLAQPLWRAVWRFLRKLKLKLPYDPRIPLLGIYLDKTIIQKDPCTPVFILYTIHYSQDMRKPKSPLTDE